MRALNDKLYKNISSLVQYVCVSSHVYTVEYVRMRLYEYVCVCVFMRIHAFSPNDVICLLASMCLLLPPTYEKKTKKPFQASTKYCGNAHTRTNTSHTHVLVYLKRIHICTPAPSSPRTHARFTHGSAMHRCKQWCMHFLVRIDMYSLTCTWTRLCILLLLPFPFLIASLAPSLSRLFLPPTLVSFPSLHRLFPSLSFLSLFSFSLSPSISSFPSCLLCECMKY